MKPTAIVGGVVAAAVGALVWAAIGGLTGYEIGIVAWGIGIAVGFGMRLTGGGGQQAAIVACLLTVAAIFAGKAIGFGWAAPRELAKMSEEMFPSESYDEMKTDADGWAAVDTADSAAVAAFMISHGFTEAEATDEVTEEERDGFLEEAAPGLVEFHDKGWTLEQWREHESSEMAAMLTGGTSWVDRIKSSLGFLDIVFILLGVSTAWKITLPPAEESSQAPSRAPAPAPSHGSSLPPRPGMPSKGPAPPSRGAAPSKGPPPPPPLPRA
jgi:hypothetical protein